MSGRSGLVGRSTYQVGSTFQKGNSIWIGIFLAICVEYLLDILAKKPQPWPSGRSCISLPPL